MRVVSLLLLLALVACGRPVHDDTTLIIGRPGDSTNIDPAAFVHTGDLMVIAESYERLVRPEIVDGKTTGEFEGELASDWTVSEDGLVYTFELNKDHYFDDGSNVNAEAVRFSFERIRNVNRAAAKYLSWVQTIDVVDSHRLRLHASQPFPAGLATLAYSSTAIMNPAAVPATVSEDDRRLWFSEHSAGSGPYRVKSWDRGERLILEPNPHYHATAPYFKKVVIKSVSDPSAKRIQLRKGDIDIGLTVASTNAHYYENQQGIRLFSFPTRNQPGFWAINTEKKPLDDVRVRQAIAYGINYEGLIDGVLNSRAQRLDGLIPPDVLGYVPSLAGYVYDPAKARKLLADAGYADGLDLSLVVGVVGPVAETTQAFLREIGIRLSLEPLGAVAYFDRIGSGNFDLAYTADYIDFADPWAILGPLYHSNYIGGTNMARYSNRSVDDLLTVGDSAVSRSERVRAYAAAQEIIADELPYIFLFSGSLIFAARSEIAGIDINSSLSYRLNLSQLNRDKQAL